ncbi:MAG: hypothetical protein IJS47_05190 [Clostridia bacterium]|nr:hypothetical protein [Clostridia bacterium]
MALERILSRIDAEKDTLFGDDAEEISRKAPNEETREEEFLRTLNQELNSPGGKKSEPEKDEEEVLKELRSMIFSSTQPKKKSSMDEFFAEERKAEPAKAEGPVVSTTTAEYDIPDVPDDIPVRTDGEIKLSQQAYSPYLEMLESARPLVEGYCEDDDEEGESEEETDTDEDYDPDEWDEYAENIEEDVRSIDAARDEIPAPDYSLIREPKEKDAASELKEKYRVKEESDPSTDGTIERRLEEKAENINKIMEILEYLFYALFVSIIMPLLIPVMLSAFAALLKNDFAVSMSETSRAWSLLTQVLAIFVGFKYSRKKSYLVMAIVPAVILVFEILITILTKLPL